jgi:hypothetical protein
VPRSLPSSLRTCCEKPGVTMSSWVHLFSAYGRKDRQSHELSEQTMDLHASQIQGFFDVPVDNVSTDHTDPSNTDSLSSMLSRQLFSTFGTTWTSRIVLLCRPMLAAPSGGLDPIKHVLISYQRHLHRRPAQHRLCTLPQGAQKGQRGLSYGPRGFRCRQDRHPC